MHVYATLHVGPANPARLADGTPEWLPPGAAAIPVATELDQETALGGFVVQPQRPIAEGRPQFLQVIALGWKERGDFVPIVRFGLADDRRAMDKAHVTIFRQPG